MTLYQLLSRPTGQTISPHRTRNTAAKETINNDREPLFGSALQGDPGAGRTAVTETRETVDNDRDTTALVALLGVDLPAGAQVHSPASRAPVTATTLYGRLSCESADRVDPARTDFTKAKETVDREDLLSSLRLGQRTDITRAAEPVDPDRIFTHVLIG